jgi:hypothetical protein
MSWSRRLGLVQALLLRERRALRVDVPDVLAVLVAEVLLDVLLAGLRAEKLVLDVDPVGRELAGEALPGRAVRDLLRGGRREARVCE